MLTFEDCVAMGTLSNEQVEALAAHEHVPDIIACELGTYLLNTPGGAAMIADGLRADLMAARLRHRPAAILHLQHLLEDFGREHPEV